MNPRLLMFARRPRLGKVKTRLAPLLGEERTLRLYRAFLVDQLRFLREFAERSLDVGLCLDGSYEPDLELEPLFDGLRVTVQSPGDLGARLLHEFRRCRSEGAGPIVVVAVDSPTLPGHLVEAALEALGSPGAAGAPGRGDDAVVSPARDGGYVLLGMRTPQPELLRDVPWSTGTVLAVTRRRAEIAGLSLRELEPWYDVDDAPGLLALREELCLDGPRLRAPATAACLDELFPGRAP